MLIKSKGNQNFKCSCGSKVGICKNLEHPRIFTEYLANSHQKYLERWALSKYKIHDNEISDLNKVSGHTKLGHLIKNYKYKEYTDGPVVRRLNDVEVNKIKDDCFQEIYRHVKYFLDNYFPRNIREFNAIVPIPPTSHALRTIPIELSEELQKDGLTNYRDLIKVTDFEFEEQKLKNISDFEKKEIILKNKFVLGETKNFKNLKGILVIDDVYKTGATARRVLNIVNSVAPDIPKYFLTVSFTVLNEIVAGGKI
jgi:hypothetical protein